MTIREAMDKSAALRPGLFAAADKIAWLAQLDAQIDVEIIRTHANAPEEDFVPYAAEGGDMVDMETELLVSAPYDKLYVSFLLAQADFYSGDYDKFNNSQRRYASDYDEFAAYYNRTYMPLQGSSIKVGG